jgi:ABC-type microcin C transport system permease subunit YejB
MSKYLFRRVLILIPALLGISLVLFTIWRRAIRSKNSPRIRTFPQKSA